MDEQRRAGLVGSMVDWYSFTLNERNMMKQTVTTLCQEIWDDLGNIPVDDDGCIEEDWREFDKGTDRQDIWHWFESTWNISVAVDLMKTGRGI